MTGTTVQTAAEAAGVECPAKDPEWAKIHDCNDCEYQNACRSVINKVLGVE